MSVHCRQVDVDAEDVSGPLDLDLESSLEIARSLSNTAVAGHQSISNLVTYVVQTGGYMTKLVEDTLYEVLSLGRWDVSGGGRVEESPRGGAVKPLRLCRRALEGKQSGVLGHGRPMPSARWEADMEPVAHQQKRGPSLNSFGADDGAAPGRPQRRGQARIEGRFENVGRHRYDACIGTVEDGLSSAYRVVAPEGKRV